MDEGAALAVGARGAPMVLDGVNPPLGGGADVGNGGGFANGGGCASGDDCGAAAAAASAPHDHRQQHDQQQQQRIPLQQQDQEQQQLGRGQGRAPRRLSGLTGAFRRYASAASGGADADRGRQRSGDGASSSGAEGGGPAGSPDGSPSFQLDGSPSDAPLASVQQQHRGPQQQLQQQQGGGRVSPRLAHARHCHQPSAASDMSLGSLDGAEGAPAGPPADAINMDVSRDTPSSQQQQQYKTAAAAGDATGAAAAAGCDALGGCDGGNGAADGDDDSGLPSSNLTVRLSSQLASTYSKCSPRSGSAPQPLPPARRVLTHPSAGVRNEGADNEAHDLVLATGDVLTNAGGNRWGGGAAHACCFRCEAARRGRLIAAASS
jgi:hypothetical protein